VPTYVLELSVRWRDARFNLPNKWPPCAAYVPVYCGLISLMRLA